MVRAKEFFGKPRWARLGVNVPSPLRRGGWYTVLRADAEDVVLEVRHQPLTMRRPFLTIIDRRPTHWAFVPRTWGGPYVVCPGCGERVWLRQRVQQLRCSRCHGCYDVETEAHSGS